MDHLNHVTRPTPLHDLQSLEDAIAESRERPVLLFKHSRQCGASLEALDEVQTHRSVSDAASERLGLRHQTPQAILLRDGKVVWNASHFRITAARLDDALKDQGPRDDGPGTRD